MNELTTIEFENQFGNYSIVSKEHIETLDELFDALIIPMLLAAGYQPKTIQSCVNTPDWPAVINNKPEGEE